MAAVAAARFQPPRSPDVRALLSAEQYVLVACWKDADALDDAARVLRPDDFAVESHRLIFGAMLALADRGQRPELPALAMELQARGELERAGGPAEVGKLVTHWHGLPAGAAYHAGLVKNASILRRLEEVGGQLREWSRCPAAGAQEILAQAERAVLEISESARSADAVPVGTAVSEAMLRIDAAASRQDDVTGVPTGLADLDRTLAGLHDGELILAAARPSVGKTTLAIHLAAAAARRGLPVLFVSLEQTRAELAERLLCREAMVDSTRVRTGRPAGDEVARLSEAAARIAEWPLAIDDQAGQTVTQIAAAARRQKSRRGLRLLVLDYLQLVSPSDRRAPRQEQVADISRRLKLLARDLACPVVAAAQLNRGVEDRGKAARPRLSDLRESGSQEQDADVVLLLHRDAESPGTLDVIVGKQRNGPTRTVEVSYTAAYYRFDNLALDNHHPGGTDDHRDEAE